MTQREIRKFEKRKANNERYQKYVELTAKIEDLEKNASTLLYRTIAKYQLIYQDELNMLMSFAKDSRVIYAILTESYDHIINLFCEATVGMSLCTTEHLIKKIYDSSEGKAYLKTIVKDMLMLEHEITEKNNAIERIKEQIKEL